MVVTGVLSLDPVAKSPGSRLLDGRPTITVRVGLPSRLRAYPDPGHIGVRRAGAETILTYWAIEVAGWLRDGRSLA